MKTEMWDEFWIELAASDPSRHVTFGELFQMKEHIERRHLPERVAEICRDADEERIKEIAHSFKLRDSCLVNFVLSGICEALRTGDLSEISRWCKDE